MMWFCWRLVSLGPACDASGARDSTTTCRTSPETVFPSCTAGKGRIPYIYVFRTCMRTMCCADQTQLVTVTNSVSLIMCCGTFWAVPGNPLATMSCTRFARQSDSGPPCELGERNAAAGGAGDVALPCIRFYSPVQSCSSPTKPSSNPQVASVCLRCRAPSSQQ